VARRHGRGAGGPPPYAPDWAEAGGAEALREAARRHLVEIDRGAFAPGDVLLFRWRAHLPAKHCAIVTAPDLRVHAHDGAAVAEVAITPWWRRHVTYAFRFPIHNPLPSAGEGALRVSEGRERG
jgi:NlpC/P60 family putative phage cell wall peptidase